eukprot:GEMP01058580.1.p1 GENE.GEMP01058580.1~~GEMP01058580.1.p1  ORF type:complete len:390 (+),score=62.46 GEMP01058580.1:121-1290(+)
MYIFCEDSFYEDSHDTDVSETNVVKIKNVTRAVGRKNLSTCQKRKGGWNERVLRENSVSKAQVPAFAKGNSILGLLAPPELIDGFVACDEMRSSASTSTLDSQKKMPLVHIISGENVYGESVESLLEIGDLCGVGSFGKVYKARDCSMGNTVAVKVIKKYSEDGKLQDKGMLAKFGKIALEQALEFSHPNIIRFRKFIEDPSNIYVVSDLYTGPDLFDYFATKAPVSEDLAKEIGIQILDALSFLHSLGRIHRDNSLVSERDVIEDSEGGGHTCYTGTIGFTAPEVYTGRYTSKCDIFSVGVVLYLALTNLFPFPTCHADLASFGQSLTPTSFGVAEDRLASCYLTPHAQDFVLSLLDFNPNTRLKATEALEHEWITSQMDNNSWMQFG